MESSGSLTLFSEILALACNTTSIEMSATLPSSVKCLSRSSFVLHNYFYTIRERRMIKAFKARVLRAGPARVEDAAPASGPLGPLTEPRQLVECLLAQRVISGGKTHVCQRGEGTEKNCSLSAHTSPSFSGSVTWRKVCNRKKKSSACLPYFFASLKLLAAARTLMTWKALSKAHKDSQKSPPSPFCSKHLWEKILLFDPACGIDGLRSLPLRLRGVPAFAVLRWHVRLHQPPTQEVTRGLFCAPLTRAEAPASCSRKDSAAGHLLRMVTHGLRMPSLTCWSMTTSLSSPKRSWASQKCCNDTATAALLLVSLEMAVGTLVACDSIDQIRTRLWAPACRLRTRLCSRRTTLPSASRASLQFWATQRWNPLLHSERGR